MAVDADRAVRHIVEPGDQLAQSRFTTAGGPHHGDGLAGANVEVHVVEHRHVILIGEGHMVHVDAPLHPGKSGGIGGILHGRLLPHQLHEPGKARRAVGKQLRKGGELAHRVHEGRDIQAEGDEVHRVHPALHDEEAAHGDHRHGEDAQEELHHRVEPAHGPVERPLGGLEAVVGHVELLQLRLLIGKGLGGLDPREAGLNVGVDGGRPLLHLDGGVLHGLAALPHHQEEHRDDTGDHQGQLPLNGEHNDQSAHNGDTGDENVLRAVVGQLRDVEQIRRQPAHQLTGAVAVIVIEAQLLHVAEQVPADVRLHQDAEGVAVIADDIGEHGPQDVCAEHHRHHGEEGPVGALRQQLVHAPPGDVGKRQIDHGDHQGAAHIQEKQLPVGLEVGQEDPQGGALLKLSGRHGTLLFLYQFISKK